MANNDATKWNYFFNLNVIEFLNMVVFYRERNEYEIQLQKKSMKNV